MKKNLFLDPVLCVTLVTAVDAQIVVNDNFNRPDGSLVGSFPTPGPGGVWTSHSGTLGDLLISGGQAVVQHGVPSEDANVPFAIQGSGLITASFDITVNDNTVIGGGTDFEYFAHFSDGGPSAFLSRLDLVPANVAGPGNDFTLGIATLGGAAETVFPIDFSYNTPINVTLSFDWGTGKSSVQVGATTITATSVALPGSIISAFALRQSDSSNNEQILVDNLIVTQVPEPSSLALGALGFAALVATRRRKA